MVGFGLILGHLVGDYILQTDWMAKNKVNPHPGPMPMAKSVTSVGDIGNVFDDIKAYDVWLFKRIGYQWGHIACLVHCVLYTFAVGLFSFWWLPWWGYVICFVVHFPIDRWRLAYRWMQYSGQRFFSSKEHPMFPWSIVVVDNIAHLITLFIIAVVARWISGGTW